MKPFYRLTPFFCALILLLSAVGCNGSDPRAALYGKWLQDQQPEGVDAFWEFTSDGRTLLSTQSTTLTIHYTFVDDDTIKLGDSIIADLSDMELDWNVEGDTLTLTPKNYYTPFTLSRVK